MSIAWAFGVQLVDFFCSVFSGVVSHPRDLQVSQYVVGLIRELFIH